MKRLKVDSLVSLAKCRTRRDTIGLSKSIIHKEKNQPTEANLSVSTI